MDVLEAMRRRRMHGEFDTALAVVGPGPRRGLLRCPNVTAARFASAPKRPNLEAA